MVYYILVCIVIKIKGMILLFGDFEEDFVNEVLKITGGIEIIEG